MHNWDVLDIVDLVKDISLAFEVETIRLGIARVTENESDLLLLVRGELIIEQKLAT